MRIIKLGGSLASTGSLIDCLNTIDYQGKAVVIVPGGGVFADQVRLAQQRWQFDDHTAHHMALLAMQQMALMFNGLKPNFIIASTIEAIQSRLSQQKIVIWSPDILELDNANIPASWDITSDSLSAWLAKRLSAAELILIKSATIEGNPSLHQLVEQHIVDKAFCEFVKEAAFGIRVVSAQDWSSRSQNTF